MSYSRWSNSVWYSFYNSYGGEIKNEQVLSLWYGFHTKDWTYEELKTLIDNNVVCDTILKVYETCTITEAIEAECYIKRFMEDVEEDFDNTELTNE